MNDQSMPWRTPSGLGDSILAQTPDAIIFADCAGVIRLWNRGAEILFGFSAVDAVGSSLDIIIPERFRQAHWDGFRRATTSGCTRQGNSVRTTRAVHESGRKLYVDLSFGLVKDDCGTVIGSVAVGRDGGDRYAAEKTLRERLAELERSR